MRVFISYSHQDEALQEELLVHLRGLSRLQNVSVWSDDQIGPGTNWRAEIERAMQTADVALLLISAAFMASRFIQDVELTTLLGRRSNDGLQVIPVILGDCAWTLDQRIQTIHVLPRGAKPIEGRTKAKRNAAYKEIVERLAALPERVTASAEPAVTLAAVPQPAAAIPTALTQDLQTLEQKVRAILATSTEFARKLAAKLNVKEEQDLVRALLHDRKAVEIAAALDQLDHECRGQEKAAQALLLQLLPYAFDRRELLAQCRAAVAGGRSPRRMDLPLRTETVAEIVLAGADDRPFRFMLDGDVLQAVARIPMPAQAYAPLIHRQGDIIDAVVKHLEQEKNPLQSLVGGLRKKYSGNTRAVTDALNQRLAAQAQPGSRDYLPRYFLLIDDDFRAAANDDRERLYAATQAEFASKLPAVRLVRLTGGQDLVAEEEAIEVHITPFIKKGLPDA